MVNLNILTAHAKLYPQNGERIVTIDSVTSFHPMYRHVSFTRHFLIYADRINTNMRRKYAEISELHILWSELGPT